MTEIRTRISIWYLISYGILFFIFAVLFYVILWRMTISNIDNGLYSFYQDLNRAYSLPLENERSLVSLSSEDDFSFEVFQEGKLIGAFNSIPGKLYNASKDKNDFFNLQSLRAYKATVSMDNKETIFIVARNMETTKSFLYKSLATLIIGLILTIIAITILGRRITRRLLIPIENIGLQLQKISGTEIKGERIRVEITGSEVAKLQTAVNNSLNRIENLLEETKNLSANLAHELRTPMTVVKSSLEVALIKDDLREIKKAAKQSIVEINGLIDFSNNLLLLSRLKGGIIGTSEKFDLSITALETTEVALRMYPSTNIKVDIPQGLEMTGIQSLVSRAIYNLLDNACKYGENGIILKIIPSDLENKIEVWSRGEAIIEKELDNLLQKFKRGKNSDQNDGFGLGLTITSYIVSLHNGSLNYRRSEEFNIFSITFSSLS